jgi:phosphoenolpyruvate carboxykinase (GTP)
MSSETTAAQAGEVGKLRFDPFAMLPFCGYNMADYFAHWLRIGEREGARPPRVFYVNWFRKADDGRFLWPGFGENSRVLAWIFRRLEGTAEAVETPAGLVPAPGALDTEGLEIDPDDLETVLALDEDGLRAELAQLRDHLGRFGDRLPDQVRAQFEALEARLL